MRRPGWRENHSGNGLVSLGGRSAGQLFDPDQQCWGEGEGREGGRGVNRAASTGASVTRLSVIEHDWH